MKICIARDLAFVGVEEVREIVNWLSHFNRALCVEARLVPVGFTPVDERKRATRSAVLILSYENGETRHEFCYVYRNGNNPSQEELPNISWSHPHICHLYGLWGENYADMVAEATAYASHSK